MFNSKRRVQPRRIEIEFLHVIDRSEAWPRSQLVLKGFDMLDRPFRQNLNPAIVQVLHVTDNLVTRGRTLGKEAITDALHLTTDQKFTCDWRHVRQNEFNREVFVAQSDVREDRRNFFLSRP